MAFDGTFSSQHGDHLWIEDDGRVGYAYIVDADGKIRGDVWLYNRGPAPREFEESDKSAAPRNPAAYVDGAVHFSPPNSIDEFAVDWMEDGGRLFARIFVHDTLVAILTDGANPGWSALAAKDGPVAKSLHAQSASSGSEQTATTTANSGSGSMVELHDRGDGKFAEITRNNHRRGQNFKKHHPWAGQSVPRALVRHPRSVFRRIWEKDWDDGRFDDVKKG
jgi:hypothetical protein